MLQPSGLPHANFYFKTMFSRRHPYLFSFLIFSTLATIAIVCILVLVATTMKRAGFSDLIAEPGDGKVGIVEIQGVITESKDILNLLEEDTANKISNWELIKLKLKQQQEIQRQFIWYQIIFTCFAIHLNSKNFDQDWL